MAGVAKALVILLAVSVAYGLLTSTLIVAGTSRGVLTLLGGLSFAIAVPTIVLFCVWLHRVLSNARDRYPDAGIQPGWAVGSFFIPLVNLVAPYFPVRHAWRADTRRGEALLATWFFAWSLSTLLSMVMAVAGMVATFGVLLDTDAAPGTPAYDEAQEDAQDAALDMQRPFQLPTEGLHVVAGVALILVVRQWSAWQDPAPPPAS